MEGPRFSLVSAEESLSFADLLYKSSEVLQVALDLISGQIDEHTSDLGSIVFSSNFFHIFEDELSNLCLVMRVSLSNCRHNHVTLLGIILLESKNWGLASRCHANLLLREDIDRWHLAWLNHGLRNSLLLMGRIEALHLLGRNLSGCTLRESTRGETCLPVVVLLLGRSVMMLIWSSLVLLWTLVILRRRTSVVRSHVVVWPLLATLPSSILY